MSNKINDKNRLTELSRSNSLAVLTQHSRGSGKLNRHQQDDKVDIAQVLQQDQITLTIQLKKLNDGFSAINIAGSALKEVDRILTRMTQLAEQSASGIFSNTQRSALSNEFVALGSEVQRLSVATKYKGTELVQGDTIIAEIDKKRVKITHELYSGVSVALDALGLANSGSAALSYSINGATVDIAKSASLQALDALNGALYSINSERGLLQVAKDKLAQAIDDLKGERSHHTHHGHHADHNHRTHHADHSHARRSLLEPEVLITGLKDQIKRSTGQAHAAQAAGLDPLRAQKLLDDE